jgi:two-component system sensor histidine kinase KdpD
LRAVLQEAERLNRYIQNLLDMTRLGHGGLKIQRDWVAPADIVGSALNRLRSVLAGHRVEVTLAPDLPLLFVHPALIEQALVNVVENAARYAPQGTSIRIEGGVDGEDLTLDVIDEGPGIPPEERERVFDMFHRIEAGDRAAKGTGLGLTICQGLIGAHGGTVEALEGPAGRGTRMRITLPLPPEPAAPAVG